VSFRRLGSLLPAHARLAEKSNLLLTPFERNLQLWRQLWRVLERSHLVVQIVDARNPLGFRCADLENYVREIGDEGVGLDTTVPGKGKRKSLLLINKADLLTVEQRSVFSDALSADDVLTGRTMWADYFEENNIAYAFFSAADAAAAQEQAEKQRRREEGTWDEGEDDEDSDGSEVDEAAEDEAYASGEEVEPESEDADEAELSKGVEATTLAEEEEGWSTEGEHEDEDAAQEGGVEKKLDAGERVPLKEAARQVGGEASDQAESPRTRVLSVTELEDLFISAAPDLAGTCARGSASHLTHDQTLRQPVYPLRPPWSSDWSDTRTSVNRRRSTPFSAPRKSQSRPHPERPSTSRRSTSPTRSRCAIARVSSSRSSPTPKRTWSWMVFCRSTR